jgi:hypothetical protein
LGFEDVNWNSGAAAVSGDDDGAVLLSWDPAEDGGLCCMYALEARGGGGASSGYGDVTGPPAAAAAGDSDILGDNTGERRRSWLVEGEVEWRGVKPPPVTRMDAATPVGMKTLVLDGG